MASEPVALDRRQRRRLETIEEVLDVALEVMAEQGVAGLSVGEAPDPQAPEGWTTVTVKAAALNHHDIWSLRGVGLAGLAEMDLVAGPAQIPLRAGPGLGLVRGA